MKTWILAAIALCIAGLFLIRRKPTKLDAHLAEQSALQNLAGLAYTRTVEAMPPYAMTGELPGTTLDLNPMSVPVSPQTLQGDLFPTLLGDPKGYFFPDFN